MTIEILETDLHVLNMRTRMPFRYGIAEMTALPHLFVRVLFRIDGKEQWGLASEGLPPKWFTKNPKTHFRADLGEMFLVIRQACRYAEDLGEFDTPFELFLQIYWNQYEWGKEKKLAPLLTNLGVTLVERAMIDAFCRTKEVTFADAVRSNALGMDFRLICPKVAANSPADLLPPKALPTVAARHTIGFGDPLTDAEIPNDERLDDGLPQSLEAAIKAYGLTHFKVKINGDLAGDMERITRIGALLTSLEVNDYGFTLDGNEQFKTVEHFRTFWEIFAQSNDPTIVAMHPHLLFVEQPFHRDIALTPEVGADLLTWAERPPIIIDESDGELLSFEQSLILGYQGTSHKNCKGVFKGIANACLVAQKQAENPGERYIISGEDLANVGPIALLQDLAVMATLGIAHVERNGHHYFRGLSAMPQEIQQQILQEHGDLYRGHSSETDESEFPSLDIQNGNINLKSVIDAPFGLNFELDPTQFTPLDRWEFSTL